MYPEVFATLMRALRDHSHLDMNGPNEGNQEKDDWTKGHALEAIGAFAGASGENFTPVRLFLLFVVSRVWLIEDVVLS